MSGKWLVRKERTGCWRGFWIAQSPDSEDGFAFFNHPAALAFAVSSPVIRLEAWLAVQPRPWTGNGYFGQPSDRDDQGRPL